MSNSAAPALTIRVRRNMLYRTSLACRVLRNEPNRAGERGAAKAFFAERNGPGRAVLRKEANWV